MKNYEKWEIGDRIRQTMKKQGFTQTSFSNALHVDQSTVSYWVTGKRLPPTENLVDLAKVLNVSIDWLLTGISTENKTLSSDLGFGNDTIETLKLNKSIGNTYVHSILDTLIARPSGIALLESFGNYIDFDGSYLLEFKDTWEKVFPKGIPVNYENLCEIRDVAHQQAIIQKLKTLKYELHHPKKGDEK